VDHHVILNVASRSNADWRKVSSKYGSEPNASERSDMDISNQDSRRGNECGISNRRADTPEFNDYGHAQPAMLR
jgi:hypothetical protein